MPKAMLLISAGCAIDEDVLLTEADRLGIEKQRLIVDPRAVLIDESDRRDEMHAVDSIGSTGSGTGSALVRRMARTGCVRLAGSSEQLQARFRVESVATLLHNHLDRGGHVIVEGTQGFGLSLLHSAHYPYVTSRDTTAAGFISEVGLSPSQVTSIVMVIRTFPIRVGGNSGPLDNEISWEEVQRISGAPDPMPERTSVTKRIRRVAMFDIELVQTACRYNRPNALALMGIDRLDWANHRVLEEGALTPRSRQFVRELEQGTGVQVAWLGTGFGSLDAIARSSAAEVIGA